MTGLNWSDILWMMNNNDFREKVISLVHDIPEGMVMSYGQIAAICGRPRAARVVGAIAHFGETHLPWHRVVSKNGGLASGYPGGKNQHQKHLEAEGVKVQNYQIDIIKHRWYPEIETRHS